MIVLVLLAVVSNSGAVDDPAVSRLFLMINTYLPASSSLLLPHLTDMSIILNISRTTCRDFNHISQWVDLSMPFCLFYIQAICKPRVSV